MKWLRRLVAQCRRKRRRARQPTPTREELARRRIGILKGQLLRAAQEEIRRSGPPEAPWQRFPKIPNRLLARLANGDRRELSRAHLLSLVAVTQRGAETGLSGCDGSAGGLARALDGLGREAAPSSSGRALKRRRQLSCDVERCPSRFKAMPGTRRTKSAVPARVRPRGPAANQTGRHLALSGNGRRVAAARCATIAR